MDERLRFVARIRLSLAISDVGVTLREQDAFHLTSDRPTRERARRIAPAPEVSPPPVSGQSWRESSRS